MPERLPDQTDRTVGLSTSPPDPGSTLDSAAGAPPGTAPAGGLRYRPVRLHAKGGLGEVYLAEDAELHREVALKEIQPQYADQPGSRRRFVLEAEVTGRLEHPGVVPVYGLGAHPDGRPFYAMRFIRGETLQAAIDSYHRPGTEKRLALRELLGRFVAVCNAVAYAHSKGVIHRDLKPANVMLGPFGETLVVDWGLAKRAGESAAEPGATGNQPDHEQTQAGAVVGTPSYMAPEQAGGRTDEVGPASDVYGLGAILFCVLTGRPPITDPDVSSVLARVRVGDFAPPRRVNPSCPPPLDAVCRKAMALKPGDRYATALDLAADVGRWLADEPVGCFRDPPAVRLARWGRRHRTKVAAAVALLATAVPALAGGLWAVNREKLNTERALENESEARSREARARERTVQAMEEMSGKVIEGWLSKQPGKPSPEQEEFLRNALAFYEEFTQEGGASEELRARVAQAHNQVGLIRHLLGQREEALAAHGRAAELRRALADEFPDRPEHRHKYAGSLHNRAVTLMELERFAAAQEAFAEAVAVRRELAAARPDDPGVKRWLAGTLTSFGNLLATRRAGGDPGPLYDEAIGLYRSLAARPAATAEDQTGLASALGNRALHSRTVGRPREALADDEESVAVMRKLVAGAPTPARRSQLADRLVNLGQGLAAVARPADAEAAQQEAAGLARRLAGDYPAVPEYRLRLAEAVASLGILAGQAGRGKEAEPAFREAVALYRQLADDFPDQPDHRRALAGAQNNLGIAFYSTGRPAEAEEAYRAAIASNRKLVESAGLPGDRLGLGMKCFNLALLLKGPDGEAFVREAADVLQKLADEFPKAPQARFNLAKARGLLGMLLADSGRHPEAEASHRAALALLRGLVERQPRSMEYRQELGVTLQALGHLLADRKRTDEARAVMAEALAVRRALAQEFPTRPHYGFELAESLKEQTNLLADHKEFPAARALLAEARPLMDAALKANPDHPGYRRTDRALRASLVGVRSAQGEHAEAVRDAEAIAALGYDPVADAAEAALILAGCAGHAEGDPAKAYADKAMDLLRRAVAKGYKDVERLKGNDQLDPLRDRPDFKKLLAELGAADR